MEPGGVAAAGVIITEGGQDVRGARARRLGWLGAHSIADCGGTSVGRSAVIERIDRAYFCRDKTGRRRPQGKQEIRAAVVECGISAPPPPGTCPHRKSPPSRTSISSYLTPTLRLNPNTNSVLNKSLFSFLRQLSTRHCSHLLPSVAAAVRRAAAPRPAAWLPLSIDVSRRHGAQQQTRHIGVRRVNDGTDRQTDRRPTVS